MVSLQSLMLTMKPSSILTHSIAFVLAAIVAYSPFCVVYKFDGCGLLVRLSHTYRHHLCSG